MDKTIQGKSQKDIFFELSGILKLEDYKFKEDTTHQAYFPSATVFNKVRDLFGFNLETEAIPLPNGKLFDVTKECNQVVVSALNMMIVGIFRIIKILIKCHLFDAYLLGVLTKDIKIFNI